MTFRSVRLAPLLLPLLATLLLAHEPGVGANGGVRVDAGRCHTELVADGTEAVSVFLSDGSDKSIVAEGFTANAILVVGGKAQRSSPTPRRCRHRYRYRRE